MTMLVGYLHTSEPPEREQFEEAWHSRQLEGHGLHLPKQSTP